MFNDEKSKSIKEEIRESVNKKFQEFTQVSDYIFKNPELAFEEKKAQKILVDFLKKEGFQVETGIANLDTSFEGKFTIGDQGPVVAFPAEYDALPGMGHACGHNIIGTSALGAATVLKRAMEKHKIPGTIKVIGTPAEERGSGKILMIEKGIFHGVDAALLLHPTEASIPDDISFASVSLEFVFHGKAAHAAAFPWDGINALSGVLSLFNSVNSLRLHLKDYTRVHGVIPEGGNVHNIIPERARAIFNIRALEIDYLNHVCEQVKKCAEAAAISTGTKVEISQLDHVIKEVKNNSELVEIIRNNFDYIGENYVERTLSQGIGSTDMGNLTHEIPAIQAYIELKNSGATHSIEFAKASGGEEGRVALKKAIEVLALSGFDILSNKGLKEQIT